MNLNLLKDIRQARPDLVIIGEIKPFDPFTNSYAYSQRGFRSSLKRIVPLVDILSIHTDELWDGSYRDLKLVRNLYPQLRILAKGFHPTVAHVRRALKYGADYVLVVGWFFELPDDLKDKCWFEPLSPENFEAQFQTTKKGNVVVINRRNVRTGALIEDRIYWDKFDYYTSWLKKRYEKFMLPYGIIQASGITNPTDIHRDAEGIIIGNALFK